jgi:hypothetical protein
MHLLSWPFSQSTNDHRLCAREIVVLETDAFDGSSMGSALLSRVQ